MAHAYFFAGASEEGIAAAHAFGKKHLSLSAKGNADVVTLRYSLFPVEEARRIGEIASRAAMGENGTLIIIAAERLFHESQNALLKVFEEPGEGTTLVLVVPSEGMLLPTMRSRLLPLPGTTAGEVPAIAREFLEKPGKRADLVAAILKRAGADDAQEKQAGRRDARELIEGVMRAAYDAHRAKPSPELSALLSDLNAFMPIMFERSAPLKPVLEHLLIVSPKGLTI